MSSVPRAAPPGRGGQSPVPIRCDLRAATDRVRPYPGQATLTDARVPNHRLSHLRACFSDCDSLKVLDFLGIPPRGRACWVVLDVARSSGSPVVCRSRNKDVVREAHDQPTTPVPSVTLNCLYSRKQINDLTSRDDVVGLDSRSATVAHGHRGRHGGPHGGPRRRSPRRRTPCVTTAAVPTTAAVRATEAPMTPRRAGVCWS